MADSWAGRLLVATPVLEDPNFRRSVVYLLEHDDGGTLGVVLNRPSETSVADALPEWAPLASEPALLYAGGPVSTTSAVCLARRRPDADPPGFRSLQGVVGALDPRVDVDALSSSIDGLRVFAGYAGWSPGQLEGEIHANAWLVLDSLPGDAFSPDPEQLWRTVLRRQPGALALMATYPPDPRLN